MGKKSKNKQPREIGKKIPKPATSPGDRAPGNRLSRWQLASLAALVVVPFLIYANSLHNGFIFDDIPLLSENPTIVSLKNIPYLLGLNAPEVAYRPLRYISYTIDYYFWGLNPVGFHLSNILFHVVSTLLVFALIFRLTRSYLCSILAALFFALHPVQTDSVTYLSGRRDILCALFYILGFYFFLRYRENRKLRYAVPTFLSYLLSLSSKEMGVTLPVLLFVFDFIDLSSKEEGLWRTFKEVWKRYYLLYLPVFLMGLWFAYYKVFINYPSSRHEYYGGTLAANFLTVAKILVYYLKLICLPVVLNGDYSYNAFPVSKGIFEPATFASLLILAAISYLIARLLKKDRIPAFGFLWFFVTILPVCQIFPHHELLAEHYLYLPMVGISLIVGHGIVTLARGRRSGRLIIGSYLVVLVLFGVRVVDRNRDWKNGFTFWSKTVETSPECVRALDNLGVEYYNLQRYTEAILCHEKALRLQPDYAMAYYNLGNSYNHSGQSEKAIKVYQAAIRLRPDNYRAFNNLGVAYKNCRLYKESEAVYLKAMELEPDNQSVLTNMNALLNVMNRFQEARPYGEKAVAINSSSVEALQNLAVTLTGLGNFERALSVLQSALALNPRNPNIHINLGSVYRRLGEEKRATEEYQLALSMSPRSAEALNNIGVIYNSRGLYDQAAETFRKALSLNPADARIHCNLGAAYAGKGDYHQAIKEYREAIKADPTYIKAYSNMGAAYNNLKRYDDAIAWYREGMKSAKDEPQMHYNLGIIYRNKGMMKEAIDEYEAALRLKPDLAGPHLNLATIYLKENQKEKALTHLKIYLQLEPAAPQASVIKKKIAELEQ